MGVLIRTKAEAASMLNAVAHALLQMSANSAPAVESGLGAPRKCSTAAGSLRHLSSLCRAYRACLVSLRDDMDALIVGVRDCSPEDCVRLSSSIRMRATLLLRWDVILERSSYVGVADNYRQLGRGLGYTSCQRLAYCCSSAAGDPMIEPATLLDWIDAPAWFEEVEKARRTKRNVKILVFSLFALAGGLAYGLND